MEDAYIYIIQVSVALFVFYLLYRVLFVRDTFLELRRLFLLTAVVLAFTCPLITFSSLPASQPVFQPVVTAYVDIINVTASVVMPVQEASVYTWQNLLLSVWIGGMILLGGRLIIQLLMIYRLAWKGHRMNWRGVPVIVLPEATAPFSFFGWIFVCPACHDEKELNEIIAHEQTHVRQWHSLDIILSELLCICLWFNPVVWLLRREIRQNLEFLADKQVVRLGYNPRNYQYHLLRLSHQSTPVQIGNNFNVSSLKKRIIMMNKKRTSRIGLMKYALLLPVTGLLILAGNAQTLAERIQEYSVEQKFQKEGNHLKGQVVDENGKPIAGVTVLIKGTMIGGMTDEKGNFDVNLGDQEVGEIGFSYVGKKSQVLPFDKSTRSLKVKMITDTVYLEELFVVGYGVNKKETQPQDTEEKAFVIVEDMPYFKFGNVVKYLASQVRYPAKAMENNIEGNVYVSFVIDKTGKVTQTKVIKGVNDELDREALRVVSTMPDWTPGKQRGKAVDVQYVLPVSFSLVSPQPRKVQLCTLSAGSTTVTKKDDKTCVTGTQNPGGTVNEVEVKEALKIVTRGKENKPLYLVDGKLMPADFDVNSIPVDKIKSFTVLHSSSATVIYGQKAKNGAVVIYTMDYEGEVPENVQDVRPAK